MIDRAKAVVTSTTSLAPGITSGTVFGVTLVFPASINEILQGIAFISTIVWVWYQMYARHKELKLKERELEEGGTC